MGFHVCEYCREETSSRDYILAFASGRVWQFPEMILHYVAEHGWCPPNEFVHDVCSEQKVTFEAPSCEVRKIGYLAGPFPKGEPCFPSFFRRLWALMRRAERQGKHRQTRG